MARDADGDGKVTAAGLPTSMRFLIRLGDTNQDEAIDQAEAERLDAQFGGGARPPDAKSADSASTEFGPTKSKSAESKPAERK